MARRAPTAEPLDVRPAPRTLPAPQRAPARAVWRGSLCVAASLTIASTAAIHPLAPIALAVLVALVTTVWLHPVLATIAVTAVAPAVSGIDRGIPVPGVKASELIVVVCALTLLLRRPARWRPLTAVDATLAAYAVAGLGYATVLAVEDGSLVSDDLLRTGLFPAFLFCTWWAASRGVAGTSDLVLAARWFLLVALVPIVLALAQYFDVPGVRAGIASIVSGGLTPMPGETLPRVTGPFPIAHSLGGYLIVPVVFAVALLLGGERRILPRWALVAWIALGLAALVTTVTVTIAVWLPVSLLVVARLYRKTGRAVALLLIATLFSLLAFSSTLGSRFADQTTPGAGTMDGLIPQTLAYRILIWKRDYVPLLSEAAPHGLPLYRLDDVLWTSTENQYVTLVLRGGVGLLVVAIAAFAALGLRALRQGRNPSADPVLRAAGIALFAVAAFLPLAAMIWPYVTNAGFPQSFVGFAGAALALSVRDPQPLGGLPAGRVHSA